MRQPIDTVPFNYGGNIRYYIYLLLSRWKLLVGVGIAVTLLAFFYYSLAPQTYTARSDVALLTVRSSVRFDDIFQISDATVPNYLDTSRWEGLQTIATNPTIIASVHEKTLAQLPDDSDVDPDQFRLNTGAFLDGDVLKLNVSHTEPEVAAIAANIWAELFISTANQAYVSTGQTVDEAKDSAETAFETYQAAQGALEVFELENELYAVNNELASIDVVIGEIEQQKTTALLLSNTTNTATSEQLANSTREGLLKMIRLAVEQEFQSQNDLLNNLYKRKRNLTEMQNSLADLQQRSGNGYESEIAVLSDNLAILLARSGIPDNGYQITVDLSKLTELGDTGATAASQRDVKQDIGDMLSIIETQLEVTEEEIATMSEAIISGEGVNPLVISAENTVSAVVDEQVAVILNTASSIYPDSDEFLDTPLMQRSQWFSTYRRSLIKQRTALSAERETLELQRDSAWNLYEILDNKSKEVTAQIEIGSPQMRLAVPAIAPELPNPRGRVRSAISTALLAVGAVAAGVVLIEGWLWIEEENVVGVSAD